MGDAPRLEGAGGLKAFFLNLIKSSTGKMKPTGEGGETHTISRQPQGKQWSSGVINMRMERISQEPQIASHRIEGKVTKQGSKETEVVKVGVGGMPFRRRQKATPSPGQQGTPMDAIVDKAVKAQESRQTEQKEARRSSSEKRIPQDAKLVFSNMSIRFDLEKQLDQLRSDITESGKEGGLIENSVAALKEAVNNDTEQLKQLTQRLTKLIGADAEIAKRFETKDPVLSEKYANVRYWDGIKTLLESHIREMEKS